LVVLLNVTGQTAEDDVCWFDNLGVYRLRSLRPEMDQRLPVP
jgi:hypothetical protein